MKDLWKDIAIGVMERLHTKKDVEKAEVREEENVRKVDGKGLQEIIVKND